MTHNTDGLNATVSGERLGSFFSSPFNTSCYLQPQEYYKNPASTSVTFPMDWSRESLHQDDLKTEPNMPENILNISRTVYAVTYPTNQTFDDSYKLTQQKSDLYNTNSGLCTKSIGLPIQNVERTFFSPNFKENMRQYPQKNHALKQEPLCLEYDDISNKLEDKLKKNIISRPTTFQNSSGRRGSLQLWQFLVTLLDTPDASAGCIAWTGRGMEFKLIEPEEVARRWGAQKNRPAMNYDKLSRSLRYYYEKGIMQKVAGERYVYKFVCDPDALFSMAYGGQTENQCKFTARNLQENWITKTDLQNFVQPKKTSCYNCEIPVSCQHPSSYLQENNHTLYV